jgi:MFS family permease
MLTQTPSGPLELPILTGPLQVGKDKEIPASKQFLINRNFRLLLIGQVISGLGDYVYGPTMLVWVFMLTHSAMAVSGILIAQVVPSCLFGPIAGVFVDRWDRRRTMMVTNILQAFVALLPLFAPNMIRLPAIYAATFLISVGSCFLGPASTGLLQVIIPQERRAQAASISGTTLALILTLSPLIATPLYFTVGPSVAISLNAISFLVLVLCLLLVRLSPSELSVPAKLTDEHVQSGMRAVLQELASGLLFILHSRTLLALVGVVFIGALGSGAMNTLHVVFVSQKLHVSLAFYGSLMTAGGIGLLLGSLIAGIVARKASHKQLLIGGVVLEGLGLMLYSQQTQYPLALVIYFLLYLPQGLSEVGFTPMILSATPNTIIGRVRSAINALYYSVNALSALLAGMLGLMAPISLIFLANGVLVILSGIFGWFMIPARQRSQAQDASSAHRVAHRSVGDPATSPTGPQTEPSTA